MPALRDALVASLERQHRLRPEPPQQLDLLLHAASAVRELQAQRLELDTVPAHSHAEHEPPAREQVDLRRLLRDERRLPLRQHEHACHELDGGREAREVAEQDERLVERRLVRVRRRDRAPVRPQPGAGELALLGPLWVRAEDVVVGDEAGVARALGRLREIADRDRVAADLVGWEDDADLHAMAPFADAAGSHRRMVP